MIKRLKYIWLVCLVSLFLLFTLIPSLSKSYPIGFDTPYHMQVGAQIVDLQSIPYEDMYHLGGSEYVYPPLLHILIAIFTLVIGGGVMNSSIILFPFLFIMLFFSYFLFFRELVVHSNLNKGWLIPYLFIFSFIGSYPIFSLMYGKYPEIIGLTFGFLLFFVYLKYDFKLMRSLIILPLLFSVIILNHHLTAMIVLLSFAIFYLIKLDNAKLIFKNLLLLLLIVAFTILLISPWVLLTFNFHVSTGVSYSETERNLMDFRLKSLGPIYEFMGAIFFLFAIFGMILLIKNKIIKHKGILIIPLFIPLLILSLKFFGIYLQPHRMYTYVSVFSVPLVAFGLAYLIESLKTKTVTKFLVIPLILITIISTVPLQIYNLKTTLSEDSYDALVWLNLNSEEESTIFIDGYSGYPFWVQVISKRKTIPGSRKEAFINTKYYDRISDSEYILKEGITPETKILLDKYKPAYVIVDKFLSQGSRVNFENFGKHKESLVYENEEVSIYAFK